MSHNNNNNQNTCENLIDPFQNEIRKHNIFYDDDFIEQLNYLSAAIKEYIKKSKKTIGIIKSNTVAISDNALQSRTLLSDIEKDSHNNNYYNKKITDLVVCLNSMPELNLFLSQNIKGIEISIEEFFIKAKVAFKKLKLKRDQKMQQMNQFNHQIDSYYSQRRFNINHDSYNTNNHNNLHENIRQEYNNFNQNQINGYGHERRNKSIGFMNYSSTTRGGTNPSKIQSKDNNDNKELRDFAEKVFQFLNEMNRLQESIMSKANDVPNKKKRFETIKSHLVKTVEDFLDKKILPIDNKVREKYNPMNQILQTMPTIESTESNNYLQKVSLSNKCKTQRDYQDISQLIDTLEMVNQENEGLKKELISLNELKEIKEDTNQKDKMIFEYKDIISKKEGMIKVYLHNLATSEEKIKQFQNEIEVLRNEVSGLKDRHKTMINLKEKASLQKEEEINKHYESCLKTKEEEYNDKETLLNEEINKLKNKEKELLLEINKLSKSLQEIEKESTGEKEKDEIDKLKTIIKENESIILKAKDELKMSNDKVNTLTINYQKENITVTQLRDEILSIISELNQEKNKNNQLTQNIEKTTIDYTNQKEINSNQLQLIEDLEKTKEENLNIQKVLKAELELQSISKKTEEESGITVEQLKEELKTQKEQLNNILLSNDYLYQTLEEVKLKSKELSEQNTNQTNEIKSLTKELNDKEQQYKNDLHKITQQLEAKKEELIKQNEQLIEDNLNEQGEKSSLLLKLRSLEEENKRLNSDILKIKKDFATPSTHSPHHQSNYSFINQAQDKDEKDNSFEEELNKVFEREPVPTLPHSQININQKDLSNPSLFRNQNITVAGIMNNEEKQKYVEIIRENKAMFNVQQEQLKYFQQLEKENQGKFYQLKELFNKLTSDWKIPKKNKNEYLLILKFIGHNNEDIQSILKGKGLS